MPLPFHHTGRPDRVIGRVVDEVFGEDADGAGRGCAAWAEWNEQSEFARQPDATGQPGAMVGAATVAHAGAPGKRCPR